MNKLYCTLGDEKQKYLIHLLDYNEGYDQKDEFLKYFLKTPYAVHREVISSNSKSLDEIDCFLKILNNLFSKCSNEYSHLPSPGMSISDYSQTAVKVEGSGSTVIKNNSSSILLVKGETSCIYPIAQVKEGRFSNCCPPLSIAFIPPNYTFEVSSDVTYSEFKSFKQSTFEINSIIAQFNYLHAATEYESDKRVEDHIERESKDYEYSLDILEDYLPSKEEQELVVPSTFDHNFDNVFFVASLISRKESRFSSIYESCELNDCDCEYDALIKLLTVSGIPFRESEPPQVVKDDRSYIFVNEDEKVFAYLRNKFGYKIKSLDGTKTVADNTIHEAGQVVTLYPVAPPRPSPWSLIQIGMGDSLGPLSYVIIICTVLAGATLIPAYIVQELTSLYIPYGDKSSLVLFGLSAIGLLVITYVIQLVQSRYLVRFEIITDSNLQTMLVDRLLRIKPELIKVFTPGSLQSRVMGISQLRQTITSNLTPILTAYISVIFNLGYLIYFSWELAILVLTAGLVLSISTFYAATQRVSQFKAVTELDGLMLASTNETISGIEIVRANDVTDSFFAKYVKIIKPLIAAIFRSTRLNDRVDVLSGSTTYILYLFLLPVSYAMASSGDQLSTGQIIAFLTCTQTFLSSFQSAIDKTITSMVKVQTYWNRALEVLDIETEILYPKSTPKRFDGSLKVANLGFTYTSPQDNVDLGSKSSGRSNSKNILLKDLSFEVLPGTSLLVIGEPGSGKSTLISLLSGMLENYSGEILISSTPLSKISQRIYRSHIANVPQTFSFQQGSLRSNMVSGLSISDAVINKLLPVFFLEDFINSLPMKLGTVVTPLAQSIPDSIKRKILLMRAAINKSKYVFIDGAFSYIDKTEAKSIISYFHSVGATVIVTSTEVIDLGFTNTINL